MPTKRNRAGNQQPYVPEGNGDASGEYADGEGINVNYSTNSTGSIKEKEKLSSMGIKLEDDEPVLDNNTVEEYNKVEIQPRELKDFKSLHDVLDREDLDNLVKQSQFAHFSKGREDLIIKPLLKEIGFDGKPQKVSKEKFEELSKTSTNLYRGVTDKKYVKDYKDENMFVGLGINGSGVYTATNKQKAIDYAKDNGGVIEILLSPNAKIADGVQLYKDAKELQFSLENGTDISGNPIDMGLDSDKLLKIGATNNKRFITLLALANGYDAIEVGNGDYIILNRTATIVKGDE